MYCRVRTDLLPVPSCARAEPEVPVNSIVFVHGLTGHCYDTWRSKDASDPWIKTLLPRAVSKARVLTYGYDAGVVGREVSQGTIRSHARNLIGGLDHFRMKDCSVGEPSLPCPEGLKSRGTNTSSQSDRPLLFACHSLGGLVVEDAIVFAKQRPESDQACTAFFRSIRGIMFFGTPHSGTDAHGAVDMFRAMSQMVAQTNKRLVDVLNKESEVLQNMQDEFLTIIEDLPPEKRISITCFAEEVPTTGIGLVRPPDPSSFSAPRRSDR